MFRQVQTSILFTYFSSKLRPWSIESQVFNPPLNLPRIGFLGSQLQQALPRCRPRSGLLVTPVPLLHLSISTPSHQPRSQPAVKTSLPPQYLHLTTPSTHHRASILTQTLITKPFVVLMPAHQLLPAVPPAHALGLPQRPSEVMELRSSRMASVALLTPSSPAHASLLGPALALALPSDVRAAPKLPTMPSK